MEPATTPVTPRCVLGCAALAGLYRPVAEEEAQAALEAAWELGVRRFDTAPHYGVGLSEERLGRFLRTKPRDSFTISTKVGRLLVDDPAAVDGTDEFYGTPRRSRRRDYTADGVLRSLEESLERLGLDRVDLALVHDPEDFMDQALDEAAPALSRLRAEGVLNGYGVGTNVTGTARRFVSETDVDTVMIAGRYSLLDRRAEEGLLDLCHDRDIRVLAAAVLNSGILVDPAPGARFNYAPAPDWLLAAARHMDGACAAHDLPLRAAALQFPVRHPAVDAVVLGAGSEATVRDSVAWLRAPVPDELWAELDALLPEQDRLP
ncbi:aldo/keto reductase [Georgenia deserti]|uniref:Aldo/keto reductase n=1 Tax=Georgenia deserti TaxID=2093781 RepID=A0ABW4L1S1_9MICO